MIGMYPSWEPDPEAPTFTDFAASMLVPDGPFKGETYEPESEAPQQVICDVMDGKIKGPGGLVYRDIVVAWCTQSGKSLIAVLVPALHTTVGKRESVVYCLPTKDLMGKVWIDKLKPAIEDSGFSAWVPDKGPGSRGGMPSSLPLVDPKTQRRAGSIIFIAGGSGKKREVGQAGVTVSTVLIDEADEYEDVHRVQLVKQRAASFGSDSISIAASTVKKDDGSVILALLDDSTNSRIWYQCPLCGRYQKMDWEQVRYEGEDDLAVEESVRYECLHCVGALAERDRLVMLSDYKLVHHGQSVDKNGKVVGDLPRSKTFGLKCWKLDFAIGYGLQELAIEHRKAKRMIDLSRDHGLMRSFFRDRLSLEYKADRDEIPDVLTNKYLSGKSKSSTWAKRSVPSWADYLYVGIDVQHDRVYWLVIAVNKGMQWAPVDWGYEYGECPRKQKATTAQRWEQLNIVRDMSDAGWTVAGSEEVMLPAYGCVDVGYQTDEVTHWIKSQAKGWIAVRGYGEGEDETGTKAGKKKTDLEGWGEMRHLDERREHWLFCNSRTVIRWMHDSLMRPAGEAGSGEIPRDSSGQGMRMNDALLLHITQNVYDFDLEKGKWYWRKMHAGRRDLRDCLKYALTLAKFHILEIKRKQKKSRKRSIREVGGNNGNRR